MRWPRFHNEAGRDRRFVTYRQAGSRGRLRRDLLEGLRQVDTDHPVEVQPALRRKHNRWRRGFDAVRYCRHVRCRISRATLIPRGALSDASPYPMLGLEQTVVPSTDELQVGGAVEPRR